MAQPPVIQQISLCLCERCLPRTQLGGRGAEVFILVAIESSEDCCREIIGAAEGIIEGKESWRSFFVWLRKRCLNAVQLIIDDPPACWKPYWRYSRMHTISGVLSTFTVGLSVSEEYPGMLDALDEAGK